MNKRDEKNIGYILGSHIIDMQRLIEESIIDKEFLSLNSFSVNDKDITEYFKEKERLFNQWKEGKIDSFSAFYLHFIPLPYKRDNTMFQRYDSIEDVLHLLNTESFPHTIRHISMAMLERWKIREEKLDKIKKRIQEDMKRENRKEMTDEEKLEILKNENPFPFIVKNDLVFIEYRLFVYFLIYLFKFDYAKSEYEKIHEIIDLKKNGRSKSAFINNFLALNNLISNPHITFKKVFYNRPNTQSYSRKELEALAKKNDNNDIREAIKTASVTLPMQNFEIPSCMFVMNAIECSRVKFREIFFKLDKISEYEEIVKLSKENVNYSYNYNKLKKSREGRVQDYSLIHYLFVSVLPQNYPIAPLIYLTEK